MNTKKAAILAIGTELTTGQIINKNASTLSERLKKESVLTNLHLTVPDQKDLMLEALNIASSHADWIFVTGGLGPTSDDFTRDVVAEWCQQKLIWNEESWNHLTERLTSRGYTVKEIQKQQCYFPETARILINHEGTAHGFHVSAKGKEIFVLPGPPREIDACWKSGIQSWLEKQTAQFEKYRTRSWDTLGIGESDLANIVQPFVNEAKLVLAERQNILDVGYRVHLPYVEFKLSFYSSDETALGPILSKIEQALKTWTVVRDGQDVLKQLAKKIQSEKIAGLCIIDELSGTFLNHRIQPLVKEMSSINKGRFAFATHWLPRTDERDCVLALRSIEENLAEVSMIHKGQSRKDLVHSPYTTMNMAERRKQYFAEYALILWNRWL